MLGDNTNEDASHVQHPLSADHRELQGEGRPQLPKAVVVAVVLFAVQALAAGAYTLIGVLQLITGKIEHVSVGIALLGTTALLTWFLAALGKGIHHGVSWVRGPSVTLQIFVILVGVSLVQGSLWGAGIAAIVFGVATIAIMLSKPVTAHVGVRELPSD